MSTCGVRRSELGAHCKAGAALRECARAVAVAVTKMWRMSTSLSTFWWVMGGSFGWPIRRVSMEVVITVVLLWP